MPLVSSSVAPRSFRRGARVGGALNVLASFSSAIAVGAALTEVAHRHFGRGMGTLAAALALRFASVVATTRWSDHASDAIRHEWRMTLPTHFTQPVPERDRSRGDLTLAVERVAQAPQLELLATSAAVSLTGLFVVGWAGGWLCLAITLGLLGLSIPLYQRSGKRSGLIAGELQRRRTLLAARQLELLNHSVELRALGAVHFGADEIAAISDSEHAIALRAIRVALGSSLVTEFLSGVSVGLVAMVVGLSLLGDRVSLLHALIAVLITSEIFAHVRRYGAEFHRRENSELSLEMLRAVVTTRSIHDGAALVELRELVTEAGSTQYSFRLEPGERVYVTGPSGSGKTTLLETMVGWRHPVAGVVTRNGQPIAYVSVDSPLFLGTLRENLCLGAEFSDSHLRDCLSSLGLTGPRFESLDAQLLADGRGFSTGERVRLVVARALLAHVAVLLLDDISGVLDSTARQLVNTTLDQLPRLTVVEAMVDAPPSTSATRVIAVHE